MGQVGGDLVIGVENDLGGNGRQGVDDSAVGTVTLARLGQRAVEDDLKAVCLGVGILKGLGGKGRAHGVGAGGAYACLVYGTDGFHRVKAFLSV